MAYTSHGHHIQGTVLENRPIGLLTARCGGPVMCSDCSREAARALNEQHKDKTPTPIEPVMEDLWGTSIAAQKLNDQKAICAVYDALKRAGLSGPQIVAILNDMDGQGVVFRMEKD